MAADDGTRAAGESMGVGMSDYYRISAPGKNSTGSACTFSIVVSEKDSEVIPEVEKLLMLEFAMHRAGVTATGPATIEPAERTA